jgi:hypothetical protein
MGLACGEEPALSEVERDLRSHYPSSSVNIGIYEPIAEFTLGVVMCQKPLIARQFRVERLYLRRWHCKQLAPVGAGMERRQFLFDHRQHILNRRPLRFPGEVNSHRRPLVSRAHPKIVAFDGPHFRDKQMRSDMVSKLFDRQNGFVSSIPGDQILRLQFSPAAGREVDAEVRQPFIPGTGNAQLFGTTFGGMPRYRVESPGCKLGPQ